MWHKKAANLPRTTTPTTPGQFTFINGTLTWTPDNYDSYIKNGFEANDIIYSINKLIMDKVEGAPWALYKVVDEPALKAAHAFYQQKNFVEGNRMRRKALEPLTSFNRQSGRLNELLKFPNDEDTFNQLISARAAFLNIVGNNYIWGNMLAGGANQGLPGELWNLPAQHITIRATQNFPQRKLGYSLSQGEYKQFTAEEVLHEKQFNASYNAQGASLYGMSPVKAAIKTLTRNNAAKKAGATQLDNNGAIGIAYIDEDEKVSVNERKTQADAIKARWAKEYTGADNFGKIAFSGLRMGYAQVGLALKDMALTDIEMVDLRILCNIWGIPSQLMNDFANKSYNNQKEAEKALTARCAIPHLINARNNLNRKLQNDWGFKGMNIYADFDSSVYTELQEDQKEKWSWVSQLPVSPAYKLELMGLDVPDDPNMEVILIDGNLVPIADVVNGMSDEQLQQVNDELNKAGLKDYLRIAK